MSFLTKFGKTLNIPTKYLLYSQAPLQSHLRQSFPHFGVHHNTGSDGPVKQQASSTILHSTFGCTFQTCAAALASVSVEVPAMGDTITEGTIASIMAVGENFKEDDVIAQIETDKVTVDVRTPVNGSLEAVKVSEGDTVRVGQVIALVEAQNVQASASSTNPAAGESPTPGQVSNARAHTPLISFPPRRTENGVQISALPAEEAKQVIAKMLGKSPTPPPPPPAEATPKPTTSPDIPPKMSIFGGWPERKGFHPPRRQLLDSEMESIMLGGAE